MGKRRVQIATRRFGLRGRGKRRFRVSTIDSNHALPIAPNLLARNFTVVRANTVWAGDMTYIPTHEGWWSESCPADARQIALDTASGWVRTAVPRAVAIKIILICPMRT